MTRLCEAVSEGGGGIFEMSADFSCYDDIPYHKMNGKKRKAFFDSELGWMAASMKKHRNLKVTFGSAGGASTSFFGNWAGEVSQYPGQCVVQFQTRPQSFHMSHLSGKNTFSQAPHYKKARKESGGDATKLLNLLRDPHTKASILNDMTGFTKNGIQVIFETFKNEAGAILPGWMLDGDLVYPWTPTYEPMEDTMVAIMARTSGKTPLEVQYDLLLDTESEHAGVLWRPLFLYNGNNDDIVDGMYLENVIPGFADAGAHCTVLTDATCATSNLAYFGRDRVAGDGRRVPLERIVKLQTMDAALLFGLSDRGVLKAGMRADLNIIDMRKLNIKAPHWANDLPTKAGRWLQGAEGYRTTILRGVVTFENDRHTGKLPGRLVRNPLMIGVERAISGVTPARVEDAVKDVDLSEYATELSRGGGASAVARVLRAEASSSDKVADINAKL